MKAVVHEVYGPPEVQRIVEVDRPAPTPGEVLIRVRATTVNRTDTAFLRGTPWAVRFYTGLFRPRRKILGTEVAGEIEEVGDGVTEFAVGDRVFGVNAGKFGAHAEFMCMRAVGPLAGLPAGASFEEAAAVPDGATLALGCLRAARVRGKRVLVYGASGAIGTAGVQLAKYFGADVTAVCGPKSVGLVQKLGADEVIDYTAGDWRSGVTYDVIFDAVGKETFARCKSSLEPNGLFLATDGLLNILRAQWRPRRGRPRVVFPIPPKYNKANVEFIRDLMVAGKYVAVIDRTYPLDDVVEATRYVETEQKTGSVVLTVVP